MCDCIPQEIVGSAVAVFWSGAGGSEGSTGPNCAELRDTNHGEEAVTLAVGIVLLSLYGPSGSA